MNETLLKSWWMLAVRGVIAILFGVLAAILPGLTLLWLAILFATYALLGGAVWVFGAVRNRANDTYWWLLLLLGMVSIGAGVVAASNPALTSLVLILLIGANALITGVLDVVVAIRMRRYLRSEVLFVLSGVASILFGLVVFLFPAGAGALALVWLISMYAVVSGILLLGAAYQVRTWSRLNAGRSSPAAGAV